MVHTLLLVHMSLLQRGQEPQRDPGVGVPDADSALVPEAGAEPRQVGFEFVSLIMLTQRWSLERNRKLALNHIRCDSGMKPISCPRLSGCPTLPLIRACLNPSPPPRACRPVACPNAGFMARLLQLDQQLHGQPSLAPADVGALGLKKGKPEGRECRLCGAKVLSVASLKVHFRAKHPGEEP